MWGICGQWLNVVKTFFRTQNVNLLYIIRHTTFRYYNRPMFADIQLDEYFDKRLKGIMRKFD